MKIMKATVKHIDMASALFDLYRQFYEQISDIEQAKKFLEERMKKNESEIFLATDDEEITGMGFVQMYPAFSSVGLKKIWILNDLFVHKNFRKQGVAEALIKKCSELAKETEAKGIVLETAISNSEAQKLYDKTGFEKDSEHYYYFLKT